MSIEYLLSSDGFLFINVSLKNVVYLDILRLNAAKKAFVDKNNK